MKKIRELLIQYKEIVMYLIFGVLTTLVNFAVTFLLQLCGMAKSGWQLTVTNVIAWIAAVTFAFLTNKKYVFESKTKGIAAYLLEMLKFYLARVATGVLEWFLPTILVDGKIFAKSWFGIDPSWWAKIFTSILVIILNYVFSKLIVFRKKKQDEDRAVTPEKDEDHV